MVFARLDSTIALAFLTDYPTPQSAARLGEARVAGFLKRHGYSGHRSAAEILERLHSVPQASSPLTSETLSSSCTRRCGLCVR